MVQEDSDEGVLCKTPLGYRDGKQLDGLITLKNYVDGGYDVKKAKVMVCVKSVGGRKKCMFTLPFGAWSFKESQITGARVIYNDSIMSLQGRLLILASCQQKGYTVRESRGPRLRQYYRRHLHSLGPSGGLGGVLETFIYDSSALICRLQQWSTTVAIDKQGDICRCRSPDDGCVLVERLCRETDQARARQPGFS